MQGLCGQVTRRERRGLLPGGSRQWGGPLHRCRGRGASRRERSDRQGDVGLRHLFGAPARRVHKGLGPAGGGLRVPQLRALPRHPRREGTQKGGELLEPCSAEEDRPPRLRRPRPRGAAPALEDQGPVRPEDHEQGPDRAEGLQGLRHAREDAVHRGHFAIHRPLLLLLQGRSVPALLARGGFGRRVGLALPAGPQVPRQP
mmetsp:Transcript_27157/g.90274  ORF Transcript_27157/g.90274 Transcript_27157/m.90274 type:complete len:201 (-) Transcript_27157:909-1511(-)